MSTKHTKPEAGIIDKPTASAGTSNRDWWPNQLNLAILHQHVRAANPMGKGFHYAEAFKKLDLAAVKEAHGIRTERVLTQRGGRRQEDRFHRLPELLHRYPRRG